MKRLIYIFAALALTVRVAVATDLSTLEFDHTRLDSKLGAEAWVYEGAQPLAISENLTLSGRSYLISLDDSSTTSDLTWEVESIDLIQLGGGISQESIPTSSDNRYHDVFESIPVSDRVGFAPIYVDGVLTRDSKRYARLIVLPVFQDGSDRIIFAERINLFLEHRLLKTEELIPVESFSKEHDPLASSLSGPDAYLIVTNRALQGAFSELVTYKNAIGISTRLETIESVLAEGIGRDEAEILREYLKQFYADGGRYVLLGGDETVLPIRYAYHYRSEIPIESDYLQVCDLYFGDVDGDWDVDGDGIWGERYDDRADLIPELQVGRLPLHDSVEVANYVAKLIAYETDPGGDDYTWLTRSFFYSSDQMRDYQEIGQHNQIAQSYPEWFEIDTVGGVESASGLDPAPGNLSPLESVKALSEGFGFVNIIAHGRGDGFVVKSSGYNNWPKEYLLTAAQNGSHGSTDSLERNGLTGFYYSLACDNGGFDLERIYQYSSAGLARSLLGQDRSGAVGMVAYSRWGWVGSSHLLHQAFLDSLFAHPDRPAVVSYNEVKEQFYYQRDLILGQNYFGDPTLKVYTDQPRRLDISLARTGDLVVAQVTSEGSPVSGVTVMLSRDNNLLAEYITDGEGKANLVALTDPNDEYEVASSITGHTVAFERYTPSLVTTVDEDEHGLPVSFSLGQNYPNPFNPETIIPFELSRPGSVSLSIINVLGQEVMMLVEASLPAGQHQAEWDGRNKSGDQVASGTYLYRLVTDSKSTVKKMSLVR